MTPFKCESGFEAGQRKLLSVLATRYPSSRERIISIHIDEINVRQAYCYKSGKVTGQAENCDGAATNVLGVLITGCVCDLIEMVALFPVVNATAEQMSTKMREIIRELEQVGFQLLCLITDNHKQVSACSNSSLQHPVPRARPIGFHTQ